MAMAIKTARTDDLELIRKITHETIKSLYPAYYPAGAVAFYEKAGYNSSDKTAFIQWLGMKK